MMQVLSSSARLRRESTSSPTSSNPLDVALADADIAFGQPDPEATLAAPRVKWVHITSAGYTRYDTDAFRSLCRQRGLAVTNGSTVNADPCAQHAAAFIDAHARQLPVALRRQWTRPIREQATLLGGQRVLIYGFGAIGRRLIELLPLGLDILAVRRAPAEDDPVSTITPADADALLGDADTIANVLPDNLATDQFFSADRINRLKPGAVFLGLRRGSIVDQDALQDALDDGRLAAALLDVTDPEPLPPPTIGFGVTHAAPSLPTQPAVLPANR